MKAKHTPGPWTMGCSQNNNIEIVHHNKQPGAITKALCRVAARPTWFNESRANAMLIAAAPKLLESLEKIVNNWDDLHPKDRQQARAAIAEAKGGAL